ncbi:hypothetical protein IWX64_003222 [Arthrobacter sp. CAN_A212]
MAADRTHLGLFLRSRRDSLTPQTSVCGPSPGRAVCPDYARRN